jgi:uncharacterized membrane protein
MKNLFTIKYWFTVYPEPLSRLGFIVLISFVALIFILGIVSFILKRRGGFFKKILNNLYDFSVAIWFIGLVVWLFFILKKIKEIPEKRKMFEAEKEIKKYLP